jgi:mRNA interferase RelE/StbE
MFERYDLAVATVYFTPSARLEFDRLPRVIRARVTIVAERLAKWPAVSGAKRLRGELFGSYRIRTGDYRVIFTVSADDKAVFITKIGYRGSIYE